MDLKVQQTSLQELKTKLLKNYPQLTEADLFYSEGNEKDMLRMIGYKLHKTKQEMDELIAKL